MNAPRLLSLTGLLLLTVVVPAGPTPLMSVDELRPGMTGTGRTVFEGSRVDTFEVQIIGVLQNVLGPRRNLILARLQGGPLAQTGVLAGMSGSPVYVDGRLVGAVSYAMGAFSKEPLAGITPIAEMMELTAGAGGAPPPRLAAGIMFPLSPEALTAALRQTWARVAPFAGQPHDVRSVWVSQAVGGHIGAMMRPVATPLVMAGFDPAVAELLSAGFGSHGFVPMVGSAGGLGSGPEPEGGRLQPGEAVGITLIRGDLTFGATGTVTHVDGNHVYAFGHSLYNLGPTQFPMTRAYIHTLLPSLFTSMKIASLGATVGTIRQDRATAVAGVLDGGPTLIPIRLSLETERGLKKTFTYQVASDQLFTPLLTYAAVLSTLASYERESGAATFTIRGTARMKKHGEIALENIFAGESPSVGAAAYIATPLTFLLRNDFEPVEIEALDLAIATLEQPRTATLERVWIDDPRPRAGKVVPLKVLLRTYRGEERVHALPVELPFNAAGTLSILVSDGSRLTQLEQREVRQPAQAHGLAQMIRSLNNARKNNRVYIKLLSATPGAVINGELLPSLPPSVLAVLEADRNGGNFVPLRSATIREWELPTNYAVTGSRLLTINVDPQ